MNTTTPGDATLGFVAAVADIMDAKTSSTSEPSLTS